MTRRTELKKHLETLNEISTIMTALRNLSLIEINKITKKIPTQEIMTQTLKEVGHDFLRFYPQYFSQLQVAAPMIYILIGSERGFCGGFNENLLQQLEAIEPSFAKAQTKLILVGRKLSGKLMDDERVIQVIDGPDSMEEISEVIFNLIHNLEEQSEKLNIKFHPGYWRILFNQEEMNVAKVQILEPFNEFEKLISSAQAIPPVLTLSPEQFLFEFINHYLFVTLYAVFYQSFFAEHRARLQQLENSLNRIEKKVSQLTHDLKRIRQEDITQEIQIIMLSAELIMQELS